ncbi:osmoprotectant transport system ATP-binding protein [Sedimentibacter acidaminivorans]|uniref:Quaternary amine transport ATP-binding protein n=1 Tax=Sedimentibacter acidaminivorans TaxID=913099 RepID=A0ABS4GBP1_9FIRM|nr:betaine/proline/choline family ABC transporter ATP-binding protein [Sedimentibacter acidaminivorans]MBP1925109.1 osmoprotectant transport system ATP-binding protein [Sedimentibacter acidaminivorans]
MVKFENVSKVYPDGTAAVKGLDLEIKEGEFVVFIGPSGCGKTTTLKMINRLAECTSGKIYVNGSDIATVDAVQLRRNIGYVIQETGLMPHITVGENIAVVPQLLKWNKKKIQNRVDELLEMAGLPPEKYKYRLPSQLSGGQKQRIGVLRGLAAEPDVVLMDEPFGALDPISRENLQNELMDLQKKLKKTIIFVTHDIDEALKLSDRIVLMRHGKVEQIGTPNELQNNPASEFVKNFIGQDRISQISPDDSVEVLVEESAINVLPNFLASSVLEQMENIGKESAQVVNKNGKWMGMALMQNVKKVSSRGGSIKEALIIDRKLYIEDATLRDAAEMLSAQPLPVPVIDKNDRFIGVVTGSGMARITMDRLKRKQIS